jgi:hypothetical protein
MKTGGSIRICGICPSRICAKIFGNGNSFLVLIIKMLVTVKLLRNDKCEIY